MRYEKDFRNLQLTEDTVLSLGKFDGLHRGHEMLLESLFEKAAQGKKTAVFTFDIPPQNIAHGTKAQVITTNNERQKLLAQRGIDYLIECPFTKEMMHMEAEQFILEITRRLCVKWIVVGTDFRFGYQRRGDYHMLQEYAHRYGYQVRVVQKMQYAGRDISSTYIREEIERGNLELANELLGYPYFLEGEILHGNQVGRSIGFPTINMQPPEEKLLPPFGVYLSEVVIEGQHFDGITNIGKKPTIQGNYPVGAETYLYGFDENVYGKHAKVNILHYVRPERKFNGLEELQAQLARDISYGIAYRA